MWQYEDQSVVRQLRKCQVLPFFFYWLLIISIARILFGWCTCLRMYDKLQALFLSKFWFQYFLFIKWTYQLSLSCEITAASTQQMYISISNERVAFFFRFIDMYWLHDRVVYWHYSKQKVNRFIILSLLFYPIYRWINCVLD